MIAFPSSPLQQSRPARSDHKSSLSMHRPLRPALTAVERDEGRKKRPTRLEGHLLAADPRAVVLDRSGRFRIFEGKLVGCYNGVAAGPGCLLWSGEKRPKFLCISICAPRYCSTESRYSEAFSARRIRQATPYTYQRDAGKNREHHDQRNTISRLGVNQCMNPP